MFLRLELLEERVDVATEGLAADDDDEPPPLPAAPPPVSIDEKSTEAEKQEVGASATTIEDPESSSKSTKDVNAENAATSKTANDAPFVTAGKKKGKKKKK